MLTKHLLDGIGRPRVDRNELPVQSANLFVDPTVADPDGHIAPCQIPIDDHEQGFDVRVDAMTRIALTQRFDHSLQAFQQIVGEFRRS